MRRSRRRRPTRRSPGRATDRDGRDVRERGRAGLDVPVHRAASGGRSSGEPGPQSTGQAATGDLRGARRRGPPRDRRGVLPPLGTPTPGGSIVAGTARGAACRGRVSVGGAAGGGRPSRREADDGIAAEAGDALKRPGAGAPGCPLVRHAQEGAEEAADRGRVRDDPDRRGAALDRAVEALSRARALQRGPAPEGQARTGEQVRLGVVRGCGGPRQRGPEPVGAAAAGAAAASAPVRARAVAVQAEATRRPLCPAPAGALRARCVRRRGRVAQSPRMMAASRPLARPRSPAPRRAGRVGRARRGARPGTARPSEGWMSVPGTARRRPVSTPTARTSASGPIVPFRSTSTRVASLRRSGRPPSTSGRGRRRPAPRRPRPAGAPAPRTAPACRAPRPGRPPAASRRRGWRRCGWRRSAPSGPTGAARGPAARPRRPGSPEAGRDGRRVAPDARRPSRPGPHRTLAHLELRPPLGGEADPVSKAVGVGRPPPGAAPGRRRGGHRAIRSRPARDPPPREPSRRPPALPPVPRGEAPARAAAPSVGPQRRAHAPDPPRGKASGTGGGCRSRSAGFESRKKPAAARSSSGRRPVPRRARGRLVSPSPPRRAQPARGADRTAGRFRSARAGARLVVGAPVR